MAKATNVLQRNTGEVRNESPPLPPPLATVFENNAWTHSVPSILQRKINYIYISNHLGGTLYVCMRVQFFMFLS